MTDQTTIVVKLAIFYVLPALFESVQLLYKSELWIQIRQKFCWIIADLFFVDVWPDLKANFRAIFQLALCLKRRRLYGVIIIIIIIGVVAVLLLLKSDLL